MRWACPIEGRGTRGAYVCRKVKEREESQEEKGKGRKDRETREKIGKGGEEEGEREKE